MKKLILLPPAKFLMLVSRILDKLSQIFDDLANRLMVVATNDKNFGFHPE